MLEACKNCWRNFASGSSIMHPIQYLVGTSMAVPNILISIKYKPYRNLNFHDSYFLTLGEIFPGKPYTFSKLL